MPLWDPQVRSSIVADLAEAHKLTETAPEAYYWSEEKKPLSTTAGQMLLDRCYEEPALVKDIVLNLAAAYFYNKEGSQDRNNAMAAYKYLENGYRKNKHIKSILDKALDKTWTKQINVDELPFREATIAMGTYIYMLEYPVAKSSTPSAKQEPQEPEGSQFRFMNR
jgi:hypothetical protein